MKKLLMFLFMAAIFTLPLNSYSADSITLTDNTLVTERSMLSCLARSDTEAVLLMTGMKTDTFAIIEDGSLTTTVTHDGLEGDATTQYDVTNTAGDTFRYTFDGTGTDPAITATEPVIGSTVVITGFAAVNNGTFIVTNATTNYFEVTNASGTADPNVTGVTTNTIEKWQKTGGVRSLKVNWTAVTGSPAATLQCNRVQN